MFNPTRTLRGDDEEGNDDDVMSNSLKINQITQPDF